MALTFVWNLKNIWPFSVFKSDDLRISNNLVSKLKIPEDTKQFVYAVHEPETQSVIYILSAQTLSERSVSDAECLIREIRPELVIAQVGPSPTADDSKFVDGVNNLLPTSSFEVLRRCFLDKVSKENYENVASNLVLQEIFGTSFHGIFLAAKKASLEVGSSFLEIESSCLNSCIVENSSTSEDLDAVSTHQGIVSSLAPQKVGMAASLSSNRLFSTNDTQSHMIKLLAPYLDLSTNSVSNIGSEESQPQHNYEAPPFAQSIYALLVDLHSIFKEIPSIGKALAHSQKMLYNINRGEAVDSEMISEVYIFRVAVEGLRIAVNNAGRLPINKLGNANSSMTDFSELSINDKSQVLFVQAIRDQAKKFKTIVAVVDASNLAGIRKHWNVPVAPEVKDMVCQLITCSEGEGEMSKQMHMKRLLTERPMLAVGAGATAVLGVSSLSKVVPASTIMNAVTFKVPTSLKLMITQSKKAVALAKIFGSSKVVPGFATSGVKTTSAMKVTTSAMKATASAEKFRAVAHGVIASAEKTSFSAMRTAFYEIMRKRQVRPIASLPWATLGCSIATFAGLLMYGDRIECVAESLPAAPSIASLGRGVQSLHQVSQQVRQTDGTRIQKMMESLMYRINKGRFQ